MTAARRAADGAPTAPTSSTPARRAAAPEAEPASPFAHPMSGDAGSAPGPSPSAAPHAVDFLDESRHVTDRAAFRDRWRDLSPRKRIATLVVAGAVAVASTVGAVAWAIQPDGEAVTVAVGADPAAPSADPASGASGVSAAPVTPAAPGQPGSVPSAAPGASNAPNSPFGPGVKPSVAIPRPASPRAAQPTSGRRDPISLVRPGEKPSMVGSRDQSTFVPPPGNAGPGPARRPAAPAAPTTRPAAPTTAPAATRSATPTGSSPAFTDTVTLTGGQSEVNSCKGTVLMSAETTTAGAPYLASGSACGDTRWSSVKVGEVVHLAGVVAEGDYRLTKTVTLTDGAPANAYGGDLVVRSGSLLRVFTRA